MLPQLVVGVNAVTRLLEKKAARAVVICDDVRPTLTVAHLPLLADGLPIVVRAPERRAPERGAPGQRPRRRKGAPCLWSISSGAPHLPHDRPLDSRDARAAGTNHRRARP
ncbi:hypothetical protein M885DRAFT_533179 [Pelagophyceae sp. CCMP2097]|nr:hypothetical protein M885DRAFT_533179 [Pelagophyceae sp. CCMP2097]